MAVSATRIAITRKNRFISKLPKETSAIMPIKKDNPPTIMSRTISRARTPLPWKGILFAPNLAA